MTQDKMRKLITAIVCAATLLLVILLSVLIFQWIKIGVQKKRIEEVQKEIAYYQQLNEADEKDLDYYTSELYQKLEAYKLGFINGQGDK
ncbi:MAG: hypothetical protein IJX88_06255 [Clostridia bacterium]|nr:hypothetical protein [Clostridia bacterium]